jgi:hypothetical protein
MEDQCPILPSVQWDGITEPQRQQLEQRVSTKRTIEQNWYIIYEILFPGCAKPKSPYLSKDLSEEISAFQAFMAVEGPVALDELISSSLPAELRPQEEEIQAFIQTTLQEVNAILDANLAETAAVVQVPTTALDFDFFDFDNYLRYTNLHE